MDFINNLPLLQIHVSAVFVTLAVVVIADIHGLLWVLGKMTTLPHKRMEFFHRATWLGLITIISAGFFMFIHQSSYLLSLPAFQLKMFFVLCLAINAFVIGKHLMIATVRPFASLSLKEKTPLLISGAVSTTCWVGAYIAAGLL
jgi:hypothetical protein